MLKTLRLIFSAIGIVLAAYGLISQDFSHSHFMLLFLGLVMLIVGVEEFQQGRNLYGWLFVIVFLLSLYVSIQGFWFLYN